MQPLSHPLDFSVMLSYDPYCIKFIRTYIFQRSRSCLKLLGTRRVTCSKFRAVDLQILGDTTQNSHPGDLVPAICVSLIKLHLQLIRLSLSSLQMEQTFNKCISLTFRRLMSYIYVEHPFLMFLDHTRRRSTVGRTPLDE